MHPIEAFMKTCLDGGFTQMTFSDAFDARAVTAPVSPEFFPDCNAPATVVQKPFGDRSPWRAFTPDEDSKILALRAERVPMLAIARALGRNVKSVRNRYQRILDMGVV